MEPPEIIDTGELVLKRWRPAYAAAAAKAVRESLPQLQPFMPWAHDAYDVDAAQLFAETLRGVHRDGELVRSCGLMARMGPGTLEIGYWIRSGHTGQGYATAAVTALTPMALALPGVYRVAIRHDVANPASGAVAAKAGFKEVERLHRDPEAPGETGVDVVWELRG